MTLKRGAFWIVLVGLTFGGAASAMAWEQPGVPVQREVLQQSRISQGVSSGALTPNETGSLERQQGRIEQRRERAWADGSLSTAERRQLTLSQDRANKRIYRLKHNDRHS
jgi:hypothetical protein